MLSKNLFSLAVLISLVLSHAVHPKVLRDGLLHRCDNHTHLDPDFGNGTSVYPTGRVPQPPCGSYQGLNTSCFSTGQADPTSVQPSIANATDSSVPSSTSIGNSTSVTDAGRISTADGLSSTSDGTGSPASTSELWSNSTTQQGPPITAATSISGSNLTSSPPFINSTSSLTSGALISGSPETTVVNGVTLTLDITTLPFHSTITFDGVPRRSSNNTVTATSVPTAQDANGTTAASASSTGSESSATLEPFSSSFTSESLNSSSTGAAITSTASDVGNSSTTLDGLNATSTTPAPVATSSTVLWSNSTSSRIWNTSCTDHTGFNWTRTSFSVTSIPSSTSSTESSSLSRSNGTTSSRVETVTISISVTVTVAATTIPAPFSVPPNGTATIVCIDGTCSTLVQAQNTTAVGSAVSSSAALTSSAPSTSAVLTTTSEGNLNASTICNNTNRQVSCTGSDVAWSSMSAALSTLETSFRWAADESSTTAPTDTDASFRWHADESSTTTAPTTSIANPSLVVVRNLIVGQGRARSEKNREGRLKPDLLVA